MTTMNAAVEAMYLTWDTGWASRTPYHFDNEEPGFDTKTADAWARVTVRHNDGGQETLGRSGNRRFARRGSLFVQVFVKTNIGTDTLHGHAAAARDIFEGTRIAGTTVRFLDVIARETGPSGKWYQATVEAAFEYDEIK